MGRRMMIYRPAEACNPRWSAKMKTRLFSVYALLTGSKAFPAGFKALPAGFEGLKASSENLQASSEALLAGSKTLPADSYRNSACEWFYRMCLFEAYTTQKFWGHN